MSLIQRILNIEFIRFCIVGGISTGIHYGIYYLLHSFNVNVNIAYTIGYIVSWCCNLYLTSHFTFNSKANIKKGIGFAASHSVNYLLHIISLNLFLSFGVSEEIAPLAVFCCVIPINYMLVRIVFKAKWFQK